MVARTSGLSEHAGAEQRGRRTAQVKASGSLRRLGELWRT